MIVDIGTISNSPRQFDFVLEPDWWQGLEENGQIIGLDGPLNVYMNISKSGGKYELKGYLSGRLWLRCARCLESYQYDLKSEFRLFLSLLPPDLGEGELELMEEDLSVDFSVDNKVDLAGIVRGQIYLSLPMKCLCREDCSGLCPVCGTNLNKGQCE